MTLGGNRGWRRYSGILAGIVADHRLPVRSAAGSPISSAPTTTACATSIATPRREQRRACQYRSHALTPSCWQCSPISSHLQRSAQGRPPARRPRNPARRRNTQRFSRSVIRTNQHCGEGHHSGEDGRESGYLQRQARLPKGEVPESRQLSRGP